MKLAREYVWSKTNATGSTLVVLLVLADWTDDAQGWTRPKVVGQIAERAHLKERATRDLLARMKANGLICVAGKRGQAKRYKVAGYDPAMAFASTNVNLARQPGVNLLPTKSTEFNDVKNVGSKYAKSVVLPTKSTEFNDVKNVGSTYEIDGVARETKEPSLPLLEPAKEPSRASAREAAAAAAGVGIDANFSPDVAEAIRAWENIAPGSLTGLVASEITSAISEVGLPLVLASIREAGLNNKRTWNYVRAVIGNHRRAGTMPGQALQPVAPAAPVKKVSYEQDPVEREKIQAALRQANEIAAAARAAKAGAR